MRVLYAALQIQGRRLPQSHRRELSRTTSPPAYPKDRPCHATALSAPVHVGAGAPSLRGPLAWSLQSEFRVLPSPLPPPPPPRDPDCAPIARGDPPAGGGARLTVPPPRARRHRSTAPLQGGLLRVADSVRRPYEVTRLPRLARSDAEGGSCRGTAPPEIMRCCQCGPERQQDGRGGNSSGSTRNPTLRPKRRFAEKNYYIISSYDIRMTLTLNCHSTSMAIVSPTHNPL